MPNLLEDTLLLSGISKHIFDCLPSENWIACRRISHIFAKNLCDQLEKVTTSFAFFAHNKTISFKKLKELVIYDHAETQEHYWNVSEKLYPSLRTLQVCSKDTSEGNIQCGILVLPDAIRLKKLVLNNCSDILSNISFNSIELEEISMINLSSEDPIIASIFSILHRASQLRIVRLNNIDYPSGFLEALIHMKQKDSPPWELFFEEMLIYESNFRNCNISQFEYHSQETRYSYDLDLSCNPDLCSVCVKSIYLKSFHLLCPFESLESLMILDITLKSKTMERFLVSSDILRNNTLSNRFPNLRKLTINNPERFKSTPMTDLVCIENHKNLEILILRLPLQYITVNNLEKLWYLNIVNIPHVAISNMSALQELNLPLLHSPDTSLSIDNVSNLENCSIRSTFLQEISLHDFFRQNTHLSILHLEQYISNKDAPVSRQDILNQLITPCMDMQNLETLKLSSFQATSLSIVSKFLSLQTLEICNPMLEQGIYISNLPSLKSCSIKGVNNSLQHNFHLHNLPQLCNFFLISENHDLTINLSLTQLPKLETVEISRNILLHNLSVDFDASIPCEKKLLALINSV